MSIESFHQLLNILALCINFFATFLLSVEAIRVSKLARLNDHIKRFSDAMMKNNPPNITPKFLVGLIVPILLAWYIPVLWFFMVPVLLWILLVGIYSFFRKIIQYSENGLIGIFGFSLFFVGNLIQLVGALW